MLERSADLPLRGKARASDEDALYGVPPSLVDLLPWVEYLHKSRCLLLEDGTSVAAFFELQPLGTEGRDAKWLQHARDALENALQDSFDEHDEHPWVVQLYAQDETSLEDYLRSLADYVQPRAAGSAFSRFYLKLMEHHLRSVAKPGGLFTDNVVSRLPWRGQTRRVRMVVYRRSTKATTRNELTPEQELASATDRITRGLANSGVLATPLSASAVHSWLLRWFNPHPRMLGESQECQERFYALAGYPQPSDDDELPLAGGSDFAQSLFYSQPRSDTHHGVWYFDDMPHRVMVVDRLRTPPTIGHLTGETRTGGDAVNAIFDQMPEGTIVCITMVVTPQDTLESHLNFLAKKSIGETLASQQTRQDVQHARSIIGRSHKLYRGAIAFFVKGRDLADLDANSRQLANVMLHAGLLPVREGDEVAPLNSYLRWLPCVFDPDKDRRQWYTQLIFAQHAANLLPVWGRSRGTGHPGITFFNRGGDVVTVDPLNRKDRQKNAHLLLVGPSGSGKSATLNAMLMQEIAIYRPRIFIVEAGNSFGLFGDLLGRLGLTVNRVTLAPGSNVSLAPFVDAIRLVRTPGQVKTLNPEDILEGEGQTDASDEGVRDILGELEITARLMITGGEEKEDARMTRADRSLIRQCILDAAHSAGEDPVLPQNVRDALRRRAADPALADQRRSRLMEMADALDMFCNGLNGQLFGRPGTPWQEADVTIVDLATFAREGYGAEMSVAYISLINTINNIAERDQFLGRPIICATDEAHIILRNPLTCPYIVKITKMWRKLGAWYWLATQNLDDFPAAAKALISMIEWVLCLSMSPDEVETLAQFRELTPEQQQLIRSARKEFGKFAEGVFLGTGIELLIRAVHPSVTLSLAMTEGDEKNQRYQLMQRHGVSQLDAALMIAMTMDEARGIRPYTFTAECE
jgi:conjugative transfer ATPase